MKRVGWRLLIAVSLMTSAGCNVVSSAPGLQVSARASQSTQQPALVTSPGSVHRLGPNEFRASCRGFERVEVPQTTTDLCWAACAEMMVNYRRAARGHRGPPARQEDFARWLGDGAAGVDDVCWSICIDEYLVENSATFVSLGGDAWAPRNSDQLIEQLSCGEPVVIGLGSADPTISVGHAVVVWEAEYARTEPSDRTVFSIARSSQQTNTYSTYVLRRVRVLDPLPGAGSYWIEGSELHARLQFMASVPLTHARIMDARHRAQTAGRRR